MSNRLLLPLAVGAIVAASVHAQTTDPNPGHAPDVFLDNHRPLIQKKGKPPVARTVTGKVVDETGQPLEGALVTLSNTKTHERTEVITKKDGRYHFEDVSFNIDYELAARYKSLNTERRRLSQYDHTANVVRILEIEPAANPPNTEAKKDTSPETKK